MIWWLLRWQWINPVVWMVVVRKDSCVATAKLCLAGGNCCGPTEVLQVRTPSLTFMMWMTASQSLITLSDEITSNAVIQKPVYFSVFSLQPLIFWSMKMLIFHELAVSIGYLIMVKMVMGCHDQEQENRFNVLKSDGLNFDSASACCCWCQLGDIA